MPNSLQQGGSLIRRTASEVAVGGRLRGHDVEGRITFGWDQEDAVQVDFEDYH